MLTITTITFLALYIVEKTSSQKVSDPTCQQLKDNWHIYSTYESYDNVELPVEVLLLNKSGKADPYYLYNDLDLEYKVRTVWTFERELPMLGSSSSSNQNKNFLTIKKVRGLGQISESSDNGKTWSIVHKFTNEFLPIKISLNQNSTNIRILFYDLPDFAKNVKQNYPRSYPDCPPDVQKGYCHVNNLRVEQDGFSWDWGPAFTPRGIIEIPEICNYKVVERPSISTSVSDDLETCSIFLQSEESEAYSEPYTVEISGTDLNIPYNPNTKSYNFPCSQIKNFNLWSDKNPKLYEINLKNSRSPKEGFTFSTGFRKINLDLKNFKFSLNNLDFYPYGSNWIPADSFRSKLKKDPKIIENLLKTAKNAGINMLRIWGGGSYESEEFYNLCDKYGILLWHDLMYACAVYDLEIETNNDWRQEIDKNFDRLSHHPSIVLYAGNNEVEQAIQQNWYGYDDSERNRDPKTGKTELDLIKDRYKKQFKMVEDYVLQKLAKVPLNSPQVWLQTSPSNAGFVEPFEGNPNGPEYGDIHYYNYPADCMDPSTYPENPKMVTEFGWQSWPLISSFDVESIEDRQQFFEHRQHHENGNQQMNDQIKKTFPNLNFQTYSNNWLYLTQVQQALCMKSMIETFRQETNGVMYWQFNDIWPGASWSGLDYFGKYKALMYSVERMSVYEDGFPESLLTENGNLKNIVNDCVIFSKGQDTNTIKISKNPKYNTINYLIIDSHEKPLIFKENYFYEFSEDEKIIEFMSPDDVSLKSESGQLEEIQRELSTFEKYFGDFWTAKKFRKVLETATRKEQISIEVKDLVSYCMI